MNDTYIYIYVYTHMGMRYHGHICSSCKGTDWEIEIELLNSFGMRMLSLVLALVMTIGNSGMVCKNMVLDLDTNPILPKLPL